MSLHDYLGVLKRSWIIIVASVLAGLCVGAAYSFAQRTEFSASARLFVSTQQAATVTDLSQGASYTQQVVKSYANLASTPYVLSPVVKTLGLDQSAAALAEQVTASAEQDTAIVEISVTDASAQQAAAIANEVSRSLTRAAIDLAPETASNSSAVKLTLVSPADVPSVPVLPRTNLNLALGTLAGALVGTFVAFLRERLDTRIRTTSQAERLLHAPLLGAIAFDPSAIDQPLVVASQSRGQRAESFKTLRTNLRFLSSTAAGQCVVITSALPSEGKSTSSANLAITIAEAGRTVLYVDADLRRPAGQKYFGIEGSVGLTDVLIGDSELDDVVQAWGTSGLHVLPAGQIPPNPSELLQSRPMEELVSTLRARFDYVVMDAPPLLAVADAAILAKLADGALLVCAVGKVRQTQLVQAAAALSRVDARVLGLVATMVPRNDRSAGGYGYEYGYGSGAPAEA